MKNRETSRSGPSGLQSRDRPRAVDEMNVLSMK